jgi:uncharacterized membrane protein
MTMARAGLLLILVPFSLIAALMAFLITYGEMRHHYSGKREPVRAGIRAAVFVLIIFLVLAWVVTVVVLRAV